MKDKNVFYVYEWFNVETKEVFYVGKGKNGRYKNVKQRNKYFQNYYNKYKCNVRKIKEGLLENEAFELEIKLIGDYRKIGQCKCNIANGGEGATFEKGSWEDLFKRLRFTHDIGGYTNEMYNEEDYDCDNLKTKTKEELQELHDNYKEHRENIKLNKELSEYEGIEIEEKLDMYELDTKNHEIWILTKLLTQKIVESNEKYEDYIHMNEELDFLTSDICLDDFINDILDLGGYDYAFYLLNTSRYNLRFLKTLNYMEITKFNLWSFNFKEDNCWHIKFNTEENKEMMRVKIDIKDIVMSILMEKKEFKLYEKFHEEILFAPIYK